MNPNPPVISTGTWFADDTRIPPIGGTMIPFGEGRPYLFQAIEGDTFGGKLPKEKSTVGIYSPAGTNSPEYIHGILLPTSATSGIFIPDGMGYPCQFSSSLSTVTHRGICIPGFSGMPDIFSEFYLDNHYK